MCFFPTSVNKFNKHIVVFCFVMCTAAWMHLILIAEECLNLTSWRHKTPEINLRIRFCRWSCSCLNSTTEEKNTILDDRSTSMKAKCLEGPKGGNQLDNLRSNPAACLSTIFQHSFKVENGEYYTKCHKMSVFWAQNVICRHSFSWSTGGGEADPPFWMHQYHGDLILARIRNPFLYEEPSLTDLLTKLLNMSKSSTKMLVKHREVSGKVDTMFVREISPT